MRTFAQKPKAAPQVVAPKSAIATRAHRGDSPEADAIVHIQRMIGNGSVQWKLDDSTGDVRGDVMTIGTTRVGRDLSRIPIHALPTVVAPAGASGSVAQSEATTVARARDGGSSHAKDSRVPDSVREVLASSGQPLGAAVRRFFEPRFGQDFGHVRVHDDARANASARAIDAHAYTLGHHLVFGPQAGGLGSEHGRRLFAHELAHVVQYGHRHRVGGLDIQPVNRVSQPGDAAEAEADAASAQALRGATPRFGHAATGATLSRAPGGAQPTAPAIPFYQEALDELAAARRQIITIIRSQIVPNSVPALEKLVALCEAIDRGVVTDIKTALGTFLAVNTHDLPLSSPSASLMAEMSSRMSLLGLADESDKLRRWGVAREKDISPSIRGPFDYDIYAWERIEERLLERIPETGGAEGLKALDGLLVFFGQLVRERFSLNAEEIKKDAKKRADLYDNPFVQRDRTISVYAAELVRLMREIYAGIQSAYQLVLDQAIADLAAGRGDAMLTSAKDRHENRLLPLIEPADKSRHIGGFFIETTKSDFKTGGGTHHDALAKTEAARAKRSVKIQFYDVEQMPSMASEMSSDFAGVFIARRRRIALIEEIYGLQKDDQGKLTAETKENAAAMAKLGADGLRLHNDDDWRKFVVAKFELREATDGAEKALISVIGLIEAYMRVFTTHTPYNIDDFGDNLLTKTFPRDLAGRLIHDCGVYALRTAYILSLLRDHPKLHLRFRYVIMPLHVGLLITGDKLPTFLVNNDSIMRYTATDTTAMRSEWGQLNEQGEKGKPAKPGTEARFTGELMADAFVSGVDLPYKQVDVVKSSGSAATLKAQMWQQYTRDVAPAADRLFGPSVKDPKSPNYQLYLQYLRLLDLFKQHYNNSLVPFWNVKAAGLWEKHKAGIKNAFDALQKATPDQKAAAKAAYNAAVKVYSDALEAELSAAQDAAQPIRQAQMAIQTHVGEHPEVFAFGSEVASSDRIRAMFDALGVMGTWWEDSIYQHMRDLRSAAKIDAPFEKPENKLTPVN